MVNATGIKKFQLIILCKLLRLKLYWHVITDLIKELLYLWTKNQKNNIKYFTSPFWNITQIIYTVLHPRSNRSRKSRSSKLPGTSENNTRKFSILFKIWMFELKYHLYTKLIKQRTLLVETRWFINFH